MKVIGIVCEYNPFHNGHKYQIDKIKEIYPDSVIIACMSSSFTQRGDISILNKWDKTSVALEEGIDIVVELPFVFSTSSADRFGKFSMRLLNEFNIDFLCFGTESNDIEFLKEVASTQINNSDFDDLVKKYLKDGNSYPVSVSNSIKKLCKKEIKDPNDLLAVSYIKEVISSKYDIDFLPIKRSNSFHDLESDEIVVSASNIRNRIFNGLSFKDKVPSSTYKYLKNNKFDKDKYFNAIKYKILSSDISLYLDVDEGLVKRVNSAIMKSTSTDELIKNIKTKRYTYSKISRMLCHILCSFTKEENSSIDDIEYIRILGLSNKGRTYLNKVKKSFNYPILNSMNLNSKILDIEKRVTYIYSLFNYIDLDYEKKNKPIIKN